MRLSRFLSAGLRLGLIVAIITLPPLLLFLLPLLNQPAPDYHAP
jgi:hypothetical protein